MPNILGPVTLFIILIADIFLCLYVKKKHNKTPFSRYFFYCLVSVSIITLGQFLQLVYYIITDIQSVYFEYFTFIGLNALPVLLFFLCLSLKHQKELKFRKSFLCLFIIPIINLLLLWTNDFHHLFFVKYSINMSELQVGPVSILCKVYTYILYLIAIISLFKSSFRSKGFFSKQSIAIILAIFIPLVFHLVGFLKIIPMPIYSISFTFSFTVLFCALAIFKFNIFDISPIALQRIFDDMSDSYIILNRKNTIINYNRTFLKNFNVKHVLIKGIDFMDLLSDDIKTHFYQAFSKSVETKRQSSIKFYDANLDKYFIAQITPIISNNMFIGTFILFKDITQHEKDMQELKDKQEVLLESERLSSLGQLIGGIAHNFKTPIMSISGAVEGLTDLVNEYDSSIDDPQVTSQDHHEIAKDMLDWLQKIKEYNEYMSDIITTVKGQAVSFSDTNDSSFTLEELVKKVNILMKHELKNAIIYLNVQMNIDEKTLINGDVNGLVQIVNNMISNSIQAYNGKPDQTIDLIFDKNDNNLVITVKDYGPGLPEKIIDKLFKEMITTKGKNGTGIGLYMSYSNIKAHFKGDITYETESGKGTSFHIILPLTNQI